MGVKHKNIQYISNNALCTACGACAGICPTDAINIITNASGYLLAKVNQKKCIGCNKCLNICPSNSQILPDNENKIFYGNYCDSYIGYASDSRIRQTSQSGGVVTAILCYLLDSNKIDGTVINEFDPRTLRPRAVFAKSKDDIINGCGSYYSQTSVVKTILANADKRTASVVLGCQAESLHLIRNKYPKIKLPEYTVGLICASQNSGNMIDDLLYMAKYDKTKGYIDKFRFRDKDVGGWPGDVLFEAEGKTYTLPQKCRMQLKPIYQRFGCVACYDKMNIYSDIVCGDPHNIKGLEDSQRLKGYTVIIARNKKGKALIEEAASKNIITIERIPTQAIFDGQLIEDRKKQFYISNYIFQKNKWVSPYKIKDLEICYKRIVAKDNKHYLYKIIKRQAMELSLLLDRDLYFAKTTQLSKIIAKKKFVFKSSNFIKHSAICIIRFLRLKKRRKT